METLAIAPDEDGYTFVEPGSFLYQELEGGLPRTRADLINASKTVGVQWTVGVADYQYLCNFNSANLSNDSEPFLIPLFIDEVEVKDYEAIILPGTFGLVSQSGETYVVGAQLEVTVTPATDDEYEDDTTSNAGTGATGAGYYAGSTEISSGSGVQLLFGSYHLNGQNAILRRQSKIITPVKGNFTLNGQSSILTRDKKVLAAKGNYALNSQAANIHKNIQTLTVSYGSYVLNGQAVTLTYNGPSDLNFSNVVLLMHCEGTNGGIVFTDSSLYARTLTGNSGTMTTSSTQFKYGATSAFFNGNHRITAADAAELDFAASDWTVEMWIYPVTLGVNGLMFAKVVNTGYFPVTLYYDTTGHVVAQCYDNAGTPNLLGTITAASALSTGAWAHVAFTRNGSTFTLWIGGVSVGTFTSSATLFHDSGLIYIGMYATGVAPLIAYADEIRVTIGTCRYTSAFTPPSAAFPNS